MRPSSAFRPGGVRQGNAQRARRRRRSTRSQRRRLTRTGEVPQPVLAPAGPGEEGGDHGRRHSSCRGRPVSRLSPSFPLPENRWQAVPLRVTRITACGPRWRRRHRTSTHACVVELRGGEQLPSRPRSTHSVRDPCRINGTYLLWTDGSKKRAKSTNRVVNSN
jgi:hypothetical protein